MFVKEQYKKALRTCADVMDSCKLRWWIDHGTLLGAVREGDFLPEEHSDIDLLFDLSSLSSRKEVADSLLKAGITIRTITNCCGIGGGFNVTCENILVDIGYYGAYGDKALVMTNRVDGKMVVKVLPKHLYDRLTQIRLAGDLYPAPYPPEEYLELYYGKDWRIPKTDWDYMRDHACIKTVWHTIRKFFICPKCHMPNDWYLVKPKEVYCLYCGGKDGNFD